MLFIYFKTYTQELLALLILLVLSYVAFFHHLGYAHMNLWDESSYGLNALEMIQRNNPIEVYLLGEPDLYNTKPPFAIWCMALAVKGFGFTEKGVRFASAFFGLLSALLLWFTAYRITAKPWAALFLPLILLSSTGFVGEHICRTGDTDGILAFWILVYPLCFYTYTRQQNVRYSFIWLMAFFVALSFACLTKGVGGLTALPGVVAWAFLQRTVKSLLYNKWFYIGSVLFLLLVPGYYVLRNQLTPGYIDTVIHFELLGRFERQEFLNSEPLGFWFYYAQFFNNERLLVWCWLLVPACFSILFSKSCSLKNVCLFLMIVLASISILLGISSTKLYWYDAPLYPIIAGIIGGAVLLLWQQTKIPYRRGISIVFAGLFMFPFAIIAQRNHNPLQTLHVREAIRSVRQEVNFKDTLLIVNSEVNFSVQFYLKQDSLFNGTSGRMIAMDDNHLKEGAYFMTCKYAREADMNNKYILDTLYHQYDCGFFRIKGVKETMSKHD